MRANRVRSTLVAFEMSGLSALRTIGCRGGLQWTSVDIRAAIERCLILRQRHNGGGLKPSIGAIQGVISDTRILHY